MTTDKYIEGFKGLAIYQIAGGILGLAAVCFAVFAFVQAPLMSLVLLAVPVLLFGYSIYCGIILYQHKAGALQHSLVNQYLQLISFSGSGFIIKCVAGLSMDFIFHPADSLLPTIRFSFCSFNLMINTVGQLEEIGINVVAGGIIFILHHELKSIARDRIEDQINSIGSETEEAQLL